MERKRFFSNFLSCFSGKGFTIVLLLSAAIIATSVWLMIAGGKTTEDTASEKLTLEPSLPTVAEQPSKPLPETPEVELIIPEEKAAEAEPVWNETEVPDAKPLYFIWPVSGILERGHSLDTLRYDRTMADWRTHDGWDISAALGTQVLSAANGTVLDIRTDELLGTVVEIDHGNGVVSCYANLAAEPTVTAGQSVQVGDVIGAVGDSALGEVGESCHLHFSMRLNGESADPGNWLPER